MSDREVCPKCGAAIHIYADGAKSEFFYECGTDNTPNHKQSTQCIINCYRQQIADLSAKLEAAQGAVEKLQRFKDWVHNYLDSKGVPHHPPGNHGGHGCRIGDRMDWVWAEIEKDKSRMAAIEDALTGTNSDKIECSIVWDILHPTPPADSIEVTDAEVKAALENAPVAFGLVQQGHIPTIELLLFKGADWKEIGHAIGWDAATAERHYAAYLKKRKGYSLEPTSTPQAANQHKFRECDSCREKPGTPILCSGCLHNRSVIAAKDAEIAALKAKVAELEAK